MSEGIIGKSLDGEPANESEHFEVCPVCGQAFDMRDLCQVLYHAQEGHKAIERES